MLTARSSVRALIWQVLKEVLTCVAGALLFGEELSVLNVCGLLVCILGILGYGFLTAKKEGASVPDRPSTEQREPPQPSAEDRAADERPTSFSTSATRA